MNYIITEEQLNTIKTKKPEFIIKIIKILYESMDMEGICELDAGYDEEDNNFYCYLIIDKDWYTNFSDNILKSVKTEWVRQYKRELREKINNYLGMNIFVGSYVSPTPCES
jgi:hypothetical protein